MNHLTTEELLELRDGAAPPPAHLPGCAACAAELARLRALQLEMRALAAPLPPDRWSAIRAAAAADRRRARLRFAGLTVAASLLLAALAPALLRRIRPAPAVSAPAAPSAELNDLVAQSHRLEARLQSIDADPRPLDSLAASQMLDLEERIGRVDAALARPRPGARAEPLWRERVELLGALVDTRDPQPQAVGL
jgi:hypothetical protein